MSKLKSIPKAQKAAEPGRVSHTVLHREHKRWMSENAMWREDIAAWQRELKQASAHLSQVEKALRAQEKALQVHAGVIRCYEQDMASHEHALAEFERGKSGDELLAMTVSHEKEAKKHYEQRQAHERIKTYQHKFVGQCNALLKVLAAM